VPSTTGSCGLGARRRNRAVWRRDATHRRAASVLFGSGQRNFGRTPRAGPRSTHGRVTPSRPSSWSGTPATCPLGC
jgi:hypothetical protein